MFKQVRMSIYNARTCVKYTQVRTYLYASTHANVLYSYLCDRSVSTRVLKRKYVRVFTQVGCQFDTSTYALQAQVRFSVNISTHGSTCKYICKHARFFSVSKLN